MVTIDLWHIENRKELLEEIGKVTVRWAAADLLMVKIVEVITRNRQVAHDYIFKAGFGQQRFDAFLEVIGTSCFDQPERQALYTVISTLKKLLPDRNDIVHSPLAMAIRMDGNKIKFEVQKLSRGGKQSKADLEKIKKHTLQVGDLVGKLDELTVELREKYLADADGDQL